MWILFSLLSALASAIRSTISKKLVGVADDYALSWAIWFFALPLLVIAAFIFGLPGRITGIFWIVLIVNISLNIVATLFFMRSLKFAPLSLVAPIISLTPVFVTIVAFATLNESPSFLGISGIILAVAGAYLLNINHLKSGILKPFEEIFSNRGSRYALFTAIIWGVTSTLDKVAIQNSSPVFYLISMCIGVSLIFGIIVKTRSAAGFRISPINWMYFLLLGTAYGLMLVFQMFAIQSAFVAYALSIKRIDGLFGVGLGFFLFKESNIREKLIGAVVILISVVFISIA